MRRFSQDFTGLGLLINVLVVVGFVVLAAKAFTPGAKLPAQEVANAAGLPTATPVAAVATPTAAPTVAPTATALPVATATTASSAAVTETVAATTTTASAAAPAGDTAAAAIDTAAVAAVVTKGTCNACHTIPGIDGAVGIVGPNLSNIGAEAGTRIAGYSAEEYLHESIVDPNAFIAPKCPFGACTPGSMPNTLAQTLTPEEIQLLIDYMLTLQTPQ
ncbi:MAG: hypothetical protein DYG89_23475 [Caldilinea sp. CFX5]|nr:hypothetical protein [Caldilinea sp. CFX5]